MKTICINILGVEIKAVTNSDFVFENLNKDFALVSGQSLLANHNSLSLGVLVQEPPYQRVPVLEAALHGSGLICYKDKNINYVVYSTGGLLIYDFAKEEGELFGPDEIFLYEKAKLTILSRLGELLDQRGLHRIHAFAVSLNDKALMCLLPMEGGKTTTVLNLLKADPNIKLLADDVCFIGENGQIYPFLLRIGARDKELIEKIPEAYVSQINRPYYGIKYFIDPEFFKDRLGQPTHLTHILLGKRIFRPETNIESISKFQCWGPIIESGVFGMGLPQLLEFFTRGDSRLFCQRIGVIFSRILFCALLIIKTKTFVIKIGLDKKSSCKTILQFLKG